MFNNIVTIKHHDHNHGLPFHLISVLGGAWDKVTTGDEISPSRQNSGGLSLYSGKKGEILRKKLRNGFFGSRFGLGQNLREILEKWDLSYIVVNN